ncbi:VanW family protein [Aneurinibacillus tyrosinisolvens]|uniref:VanW family protein n=1 Tax=Aneurinibacillus tyrosinisolvens TaxID=1443435 RepID=UPI00063EDE39|nr:VanW family protein [Aneurinibacillus tyrosinisolvens]
MLQRIRMTYTPFLLALLFFQIVVFSSIALYLSGEWKNGTSESSPFDKTITVAGVSLGGLSEEEAKMRIEQLAKKLEAAPLQLTLNEKKYTVSKQRMDIVYNTAATIEEAKRTSRQLSGLAGLWEAWRGTPPSTDLALTFTFKREELISQVDELGQLVNRPSSPATGRVTGKTISVTPEMEGYELNVAKTVDDVTEELGTYRHDFKVPLAIKKDIPKVTRKSFGDINTLLAEQVVTVETKLPSTVGNVHRASDLLDGQLIPSQGKFSFNEKTGPFTAEEYLPITVQTDGQEWKDNVALDVSRVASALYVAALKSHLPIIERHSHQYPVTYTQAGLDAFVDGKQADLRFINRYKNPVFIHTEMNGNKLHIALFGENPAQDEIAIDVKEEGKYAPGTIVRTDSLLPPGQEKIIRHGTDGARVKVTISWKAKDGAIKTEQISDDYYEPLNNLIAVGPGEKGQSNTGGMGGKSETANNSTSSDTQSGIGTTPAPIPDKVPGATESVASPPPPPIKKDSKDNIRIKDGIIYLN